ncbi:MAG: eRF1 domain 2 [Cryobacterium sp.]|nr:eRF1 domain 2 [Oligoflexia bacterium]
MSARILFIDSDHAKIFKLNADKIDTHAMKKHDAQHQVGGGGKEDEQEKHFFHDVAKELAGTTELLVVGPGLAKIRFKTHLETHHHQDLCKAVVGMEAIDHPTDPQIMAVGKKFFKTYNLFH